MGDVTVVSREAARSWKPLMPGISIALLREHEGERSLFLRMEAGARFPRHAHPGGEQLVVLSGDVQLAEHDLAAGDFLYTAPGELHAVASRGGCLLFITVRKPIEIVGEAASGPR